MAVRDDIIASLVEAIARINERMQVVDDPQSTQLAEDEIKTRAAMWLLEAMTVKPEDGKDGADGRDGKDGRDGRDGRPPTPEEIALAVEAWFAINEDRLRGPKGERGQDGRPGRDGVDGQPGRDGRDGADGAAGADGVGIASVDQSKAGLFTIRLTDGREYEIRLPVSLSGGGGGSSGKGGASALSQLSDVAITDPVAGQALIYSDGKWVNGAGGGGGGPANTDELPEGTTNLYFTQARARDSISATGALSYDAETGILDYEQPTALSAFDNDVGFITGISGSMVESALGYAPADSASLATVALSGSYDDLSDKPTISSLLPSQTGNAGKFLTTDGTSPAWATVDTNPTLAKLCLMGF